MSRRSLTNLSTMHANVRVFPEPATASRTKCCGAAPFWVAMHACVTAATASSCWMVNMFAFVFLWLKS